MTEVCPADSSLSCHLELQDLDLEKMLGVGMTKGEVTALFYYTRPELERTVTRFNCTFT